MRVGICIPCIGNHIEYLDKCIESFDFQTQKPDVISISLSSYTTGELKFNTTIPVFLQVTCETNSASKNRNIAAKRIENMVDLLVFFDADDFIHPAAIQYTKQYFTIFNGDCLLHRYLDFPKNKYFKFKIKSFLWPELSGKLSDDCNLVVTKDSVCGRIDFYRRNNEKHHHANGHLTCKVEVWKDLCWPEDYGNMGEDSEYNFRIFSKGYKYMYTEDIISLYCR